MTYDDRELLASFHAAHSLNYPLLQDEEVRHVKAYGILDEAYQPGDSGYGIPHPGILYIGADGEVLEKFAVPGYRQRPPFEDILQAITRIQGDP
jgi:peroxiredoxin